MYCREKEMLEWDECALVCIINWKNKDFLSEEMRLIYTSYLHNFERNESHSVLRYSQKPIPEKFDIALPLL